MGDVVLGVDCSTTASKVIAWDRDGGSVGEGRAPLTETRPSAAISEQKAEGWWEATSEALREVADAVGAVRVDAICITHQRESYAPGPETVIGLAGVGDLEVTGLSGRNKVYGSRIGRGEAASEAMEAMTAAEQTVEGVPPRGSPPT